MTRPGSPSDPAHYKDKILDRLAREVNVAQFVSYAPDLEQRFARIRGSSADETPRILEQAAGALLEASVDRSVNVRSFDPRQPGGSEFVYGLTEVGDVLDNVHRLAGQGLFTIVNETIDVDDGGVSGVAYGRVLEFAPGGTPRVVEEEGVASMPREIGCGILDTVYGFRPELPEDPELRVEFSIHPLRRGFRNTHTIIWEIERQGPSSSEASVTWPHRFSRHVGDKAFGLLVADTLGLPVPHTLVVARRVAPFAFGRSTGTAESWIRTAPLEQVPGRFTTEHSWIDPFALMQREDPQGTRIASILSQDGVHAAHSGAAVTEADGNLRIEGVSGKGDRFMVGDSAPIDLPTDVLDSIRSDYTKLSERLGAVRFEWVHDGRSVWIVQLHSGASASFGRTLFPGEAETFHDFPITEGLEALRELVARVQGSGDGIVLIGRVGVTSHFGDVLRRARIPSRIEAPGDDS